MHLNRASTKTVTELLEYFKLVDSYPEGKQLSYIIDDNKYESIKTAIVDLAFGLGCEYINIIGINKAEKLSKVIRFAEIVEQTEDTQVA